MKKKVLIPIVIIGLVAIIQFYPKLSLSTASMKTYDSNYITYNYENTEQSVIDQIAENMDNDARRINEKLNFDRDTKTNIFIYPNQEIFHRKKYGTMIDVVKLFNNLDWYIGDNVKDNITLVSPLNPGTAHSEASVIGAIPHEYVHTIVYQINPEIPLWINEGLALYLTNGYDLNGYKSGDEPSFEDIQTSNPIKFSNMGGYDYAHIYIEYLDSTFGFDSILNFLYDDLSYEQSFGMTEREIYDGWLDYLNTKYANK